MLDNVIEISNLPLEKQRSELFRKRRHGIGFLGAGSMFNMMMMRYGGPESVKLISKISQILAETSVRAGIDLAILKGPAPIMNEEFVITKKLLNKFPKLASHFTVGEKVFGKELIVYSDYMQRIPLELREEVLRYGMRFSHATSIAPTGTMALGIENNCCVAKGTTIKTSVGDILIENVSATDHKVLVYIPSIDKFEYKEIEFCGLTRPNASVLEIELEDNTTIKVTPDHKILIKNIHTNKLEYIEAQHINIFEHEIVTIPPVDTCKICNTRFLNRRSMIAHISKKHKIPTIDYQYFHEGYNSCSVCHKPMTIEEVKVRFRYGKLIKDQTCSEECSFDAKLRNENYFMKYYNITNEEARSLFLKKYENRASLPNQIEYWTRKGYSEEDAKKQVSLSQNRTSMESFISRYGETEGLIKYNDFCKNRSNQYSGDNNPRFGTNLTHDQKLKISDGVKNSLTNLTIIENIVESRNNSNNIQHSAIVGIREIDIWKILNEMKIQYSSQFHVIVPLIFKSKIDRNYIVYDILLPEYNCVIELNEGYHTNLKQRIIDNIRSDIAINLGYKYIEIWLTDENDIKTQIFNVISKLNKEVA